MKNLSIILVLALILSVLEIPMVYAESLKDLTNVISVDFTNATFKSNATGVEGPVLTGTYPIMNTYDILTYNNLSLAGDKIAFKALFDKEVGSRTFNCYVTYDDNSQERIEFSEVDVTTDPIFHNLTLSAGRKIVSIKASHGATGRTVEIYNLYIHTSSETVYTLSDGTFKFSNMDLTGGGSISNDILYMNDVSRPALRINQKISGIQLTVNKHMPSADSDPTHGGLTVRFYVGDWNEAIFYDGGANPYITKDVASLMVPVPTAMKGQTITKITLAANGWIMLRKVDYFGQDLPKATATPTASRVLVSGSPVSFDAYNIGGSNYFKLRDLAMALNGSLKQFEVGYDGATKSITLTTSTAYTPNNTELKITPNRFSKLAATTASKIYMNGVEVKLTAYNIDGANYFKLRDIGKAINFGVTFDPTTKSIVIDPIKVYTE